MKTKNNKSHYRAVECNETAHEYIACQCENGAARQSQIQKMMRR